MTTRGTPSGLLAQSQAVELKPAWLVQIKTGTSPATLYYTTFLRTVSFPSSGGNDYAPWPMSLPGIGLGEESEGGGAGELRLADADAYLKGLGADWAGKRVVVYRVDMDHLDAVTKAYRNDFWIDAPEWGTRELILHLGPFRSKARRHIPRDLVTRTLFPGMP